MSGIMRLLPPELSGPDTQRWHELRRYTEHGWSITASEIAAIVNLSPWSSSFALYWQKLMGWRIDDNPYMEWGRRFEGVIAEEFAERFTDEYEVMPIGLCANPDRPWQMATPDMLARPHDSDEFITVQIKTEHHADSLYWGSEGSDYIPVHYRAQVQWEIDVCGGKRGFLYLLPLDSREPRLYEIRRDDTDIKVMVEHAERFRRRLDNGEAPDVDGSPSSLQIVKQLHPDLEDREQEISAQIASGYLRAKALNERTERLYRELEARVRLAMGDARYATVDGRKVASRSMYPHYLTGKIVDKLTPKKGKRA